MKRTAGRIEGVLLVAGAVALWVAGCGPTAAQSHGSGQGGAAPLVRLLVSPDEDTASILDAIRSARRRVLVEMYILTAPAAVSALLAAHAAGAEVRVLLEPVPYGDPTANEAAYALLAAAGVDVRWSRRPVGLLHAKLIVVDGCMAYVMTLNLTEAGLHRNREYVAVNQDPGHVRWAERIWNADAVAADPGMTPHDDGNHLLVSPVDARARLGHVIDAARLSIWLEMEELSDRDLVAALVDAHHRGASVTVVAPAAGRSVATTLALRRLAEVGVAVRLLTRPVVHAKAMVVDGRLSYIGSVNFTRASLDDNREVGVMLDDVAVARRLTTTITADATAALPF